MNEASTTDPASMPAVAVTARTTCRGCGAGFGEPVVQFASVPVAGIYLHPDECANEPRAPLTLQVCAACGLAQLAETVDPAVYRRYAFSGGHVGAYRAQVERTAAVVASLSLPAGATVVEVGSNDGTLLRLLAAQGLRTVGFEPAETFEAVEAPAGGRIVRDFFSRASAAAAGVTGAATVVARHVLEHVADLDDFAAAMHAVLAPEGVAVLEVPDAAALVREGVISNLFHEHLTYFSEATLAGTLAARGFEPVRWTHGEAHGGSLVGVFRRVPAGDSGRAAPAGRARPTSSCATQDTALDWQVFAEAGRRYLERFRALLAELRAAGGLVVGYGAAQRTTALVGMAELPEGAFDYFVDGNPRYHGQRVPGVRRPIYGPGRLLADRPAVVVVLARSFEETIVRENQAYLAQGGVMISTRDDRFVRITA